MVSRWKQEVDNLREVLLDVGIGVVEEINATVNVSELTNAQAVTRIELRLKVVATSIADICELKQVGGSKQDLDILFSHDDDRRVNVFNEKLKCVIINALNRDAILARLFEPREHRVEVRTARGEDHLVSWNLHSVSD